MSLLAGALGYVRLAEPARFRAAWEQAASLRLRDGDVTVLADYDQRGRIVGGEPEQMMDAVAAAYVALAADGTDTLLMAAEHALRRELSRRIRDDLIALGIVEPGPAVRIADGAPASPGDLITCTRNDHALQAGEPGRMLANGDLLRIETVTGAGLVVRRALDADPATGQRRWTDRTFLYQDFHDAELGYAVTDHVAQGRTVHTGLAVITGTEDRQHAYVALSRGTDANLAYVFTTSPKRADPVPGPRPAPELARYDQIHAERDGARAPGPRPAPPGTALGVLAGVLDRDGQQHSATQTRNQAHADADHLAVLHAIWTAETTPARRQRYRDLLAAALPPEHRRGTGHQARWLFRTLRAAELAGLDPPRSSPPRPANGTWPGPATWPPSWTPGSAPGSAPWFRSARGHGPRRSPPSPARTPRLRHRDRRPDGRAQGPDRRARRRARPALGGHRARPGPRAPAGPAGLAAAGRVHRRLAGAEATAAARRGERHTAARQRQLGDSYQALHEAYRQRETVFAAIMADRADWAAATRTQRHLAVTADAELRRRHPGQHYPPLRSAEPPPATQAQRDELTLTAEQPIPQMGQWVKDLAVGHWTFVATLADRQSLTVPSQDHDYDYGHLGQAFPPWPGPARDAILQPPKPEIRPSPQVLQRAAHRDADPEAAD
jgi:hypothetical protein